MSETTGQKLIKKCIECKAILNEDNWYPSFLNAGSSGPVDMIAMDKDGNTILIDVKTMQKDYRTTNNIYTQRKQRTEIQKDLGVNIVSFNPKTRKLNFVNHKEENQLELF